MKNFQDNLICLDLGLVKSVSDLVNFSKKYLNGSISESMIQYVFVVKEEIGVKKVFFWLNGDIALIEFEETYGVRNISTSIFMEESLNSMKSVTPKTKISKDGIIMIEPGRFTQEELSNFFIKNFGVDNISEEIFTQKSKKGISKFWIWGPSQEIIFFKWKSQDTISTTEVEKSIDGIKVLGLNESDFVVPVKLEVILDMDSILDKISKYGMDSLVSEELEFLKGIK